MKPRIKIAAAQSQAGGEIVLYKHDKDFSITIDGQDLMHSRQHESELELARLGCAHLLNHEAPEILIGGLGMGYTLRQALDLLNPHARVTVGELLDVVVQWNREFLGALNGQALTDRRVQVKTGDIIELISRSHKRFDAILLDIDNGPHALTAPHNERLYGHAGIQSCRHALKENGCLAVWSAETNGKFEQRLLLGGFHVRRFRVSAAKGHNSSSRFIWIAAKNEDILPPGGIEPRRQECDRSQRGRKKGLPLRNQANRAKTE